MPRPYVMLSAAQKIERLKRKKEWLLKTRASHQEKATYHDHRIVSVENRLSQVLTKLSQLEVEQTPVPTENVPVQ